MEVGQEIRKAAGGSSVVYLARPDAPYFVALSTNCRYPTATLWDRSARTTDAASLVSLQENLACLRDPAATFLVLQPAMIDPKSRGPIGQGHGRRPFRLQAPDHSRGQFHSLPSALTFYLVSRTFGRGSGERVRAGYVQDCHRSPVEPIRYLVFPHIFRHTFWHHFRYRGNR